MIELVQLNAIQTKTCISHRGGEKKLAVFYTAAESNHDLLKLYRPHSNFTPY